MDNTARKWWVENDDGLYSWYRASKMDMAEFVQRYARRLDVLIGKLVRNGSNEIHS